MLLSAGMKVDIGWALDDLKSRCKDYAKFAAYATGDHPLNFATEKFRNAFGPLVQKLKDNVCPGVLDAFSDRLRIEAFDGDDAAAAQELWGEPGTRLPRLSTELHYDAFLYGDSYLVVWAGEDGKVRFWQHDPEIMTVRYDEEDDPGKIEVAAKIWTDRDEYGRCTLFYADHIERYTTVRPLAADSGYPEKEELWGGGRADPNPYDIVPVFHFANGGKIGQMGASELVPVIPLQDALNKSLCDMMVNDEFLAFPQRWATGLEVEIDEDTGRVKSPPFTPGADRVWTGGAEVTFGQFTASDHASYIAIQESLRIEIARVAGLPAHLLMPDHVAPTGEGMKVAEGRMTKKLEKRQIAYGEVWGQAVRLALAINGESDDADITLVWKSSAPHNPLLDAETELVLKQVGISTAQALKELGYSKDDVERIMKEKDEEAEAQMKMAAANTPQPMGPGGTPQTGKPTPYTRNGSPGVASKPAPLKQQQNKAPIKA